MSKELNSDLSADLNKDISAAIAKNLPAALGEELQAQLRAGAEAIRDVKILTQQNIKLGKDLDLKVEELEKHADIDSRLAGLSKLQEALEVKERNLKVTLLEREVEVQKENAEFARNLALGLVRNIDYRKAVYDNNIENVPYQTRDGYMSTHVVNNTKTYQETETAT